MRFSKVIAVTLAAGPAGALAAYEKARSSFAPQPPQPDFGQVVEWARMGNDWVALGTILLAAISTGYSIYQMFQPDPATKADVKDDGRKTRVGVEAVSAQVAAEGRASDAGHGLTQKLVAGALDERLVTAVDADLMSEEQLARIFAKVAEKLGVEAAPAATQNIVDAAGRSSDEVQALLADGKFAEAGAAQRRLAEAGDARQAQAWRDTARILVLTSITEAITAYARAVELDPTHFWTWIELSRLHQTAGSLPEARRTAEAALQHSSTNRERGVAEHELGDIAFNEGQLDIAKTHFQSFLSASQVGADTNPDDVAWQRDLSISHERLGNVAREEGDLAGARKGYGASLAIRERLAAADPGNAAWQRDLSVSHNNLGDVARRMGNLVEAQFHFAKDLEICERLAESDPDNAEWQRDVFISHATLAQLKEASGDVAGAIAEFEAGEAILVALIARVGDHPGFARDLANVRREIARLRGE